MGSKKDASHWEFLEGIEAPMWADLAVETKCIDKEIDDEWFHVSHQFHQRSSRQLKAVFSHLEISGNSDFDLGEFASPKLPSSVSKSRGKKYVSRKWKGDSCTSTSSEQHPVEILRGKTSAQDLKFTSVNEKGISSLRSDLDSENAAGSVVVTHSSNSASCSTSLANSGVISFQQDVSNQLVGRKSGLLSVLRLSIRRSHATRPASRVEIIDSRQLDGQKSSSNKSSLESSSNPSHSANAMNPSKVEVTDGRKPSGRKSSSSKSSVGSSSIQSPSLKNMITERQNKDRTADSRNVPRLSKPADNKEKLNLLKASKSRMGNNASEHPKGNKAIITNSTHPEAAKSKTPILRKALVPLKVNEQGSLVAATKSKDKVHVIATNRSKGCGKENTAISWKPGGKAIMAGGMPVYQKIKPTEIQKCGRPAFHCVKGKTSIHDERKMVKEMAKLYHR